MKTQLELKHQAPIKNKALNSSTNRPQIVCLDVEAAVDDVGPKFVSPVSSRNR